MKKSIKSLFLGLLFLGVVLFNGYQAAGYVRLLAFGENVNGTVVKKLSRSGNGTTRYGLEYDFQLEGERYTRSIMVSKSYYDKLSSKAPLPVVYIPGSPEVNDYKSHLWSKIFSRLLTMIICGSVVLVGFAITFYASRMGSKN